MTGADLTPVPREARAYQRHRAGLATRFVADTIDALVVAVAVVAGWVVVNAVVFFFDPRGFEVVRPRPLLTVSTLLVAAILYLTAAWATVGRSYGCHVMGLRVVGRWGGRLGVLLALARAVLCVLFPIGLFWVAVSPANRSLEDVLLRTSVIYDWLPGGHETRPH